MELVVNEAKKTKKTIPQLAWLSTVFIELGSCAKLCKDTGYDLNCKQYFHLIEQNLKVGQKILSSCGIILDACQQEQATSEEAAESVEDSRTLQDTLTTTSTEWTSLKKAKKEEQSEQESPSTFKVSFDQIYPAYVYHHLAKAVSKVLDELH